jgi:hypothetical protein
MLGNFFGSIYSALFEDFYGLDLSDYLWGIASSESQTNLYIGIGLWMLGISAFMVVVYYYIVNHPKLNNWWGWSIFLGVNAVINFVVGWQWVLSDYYNNKMVTIDPATNHEMPLNIGPSEIVCFGVSNMLLSILAYFILSFVAKWWSKNCPNAPF